MSSGFAAAALSTVALLAAGCDEGTMAPPFPEGQGQSPEQGPPYPAGPYGIDKGSVIQNFKFVGFPDPSEDRSETFELQLADFYNPTGDGVFPEGSVLGAGEPKPKGLLVNIGAVWCQPCQYEADVILPGHYEEVNAEGIEFFLILADGPNVGVAATETNLAAWTSKYDTFWPGAIDPNYTIGSLFKASAFPVNLVIDTETMEIVEAVAGLPEEGGPLFQAIDDLAEE
jgi:hypothetical protein